MFTSNHDENSWAGTEFERMGDAVKVMAMLTFTLPNGQPLIYTGQEMGWNKRFEFFEKDHIPAWEDNEYAQFYKELTSLRHNNAALAAGERGGKIEYIDNVPEGVFAFRRAVEGNEVTVYANLTNAPVQSNDINLDAWGWNIITK
jgi:glycosidase